jgi:predicted CoA-binding protein
MTTLIIGASTHPHRYSYQAAARLLEAGHSIVLLGKQPDVLFGLPILKELPNDHPAIDTVTMYLNPKNQEAYHELILDLQPRRVIFNPGTEHPHFMEKLVANRIEVLPACTLVMLSIGAY